ncbi:hypothetical protein ADEAN_000110800 [Angomonas deanei]|uniref:Uncharacterized protein n=1 Tax=Angomonas deanei TaxID=59799 RepID=A0A7G2C297_9TRYP|nr:hypothetical protein ADEAN_000110800 [Angomonas deanei]
MSLDYDIQDLVVPTCDSPLRPAKVSTSRPTSGNSNHSNNNNRSSREEGDFSSVTALLEGMSDFMRSDPSLHGSSVSSSLGSGVHSDPQKLNNKKNKKKNGSGQSLRDSSNSQQYCVPSLNTSISVCSSTHEIPMAGYSKLQNNNNKVKKAKFNNGDPNFKPKGFRKSQTPRAPPASEPTPQAIQNNNIQNMNNNNNNGYRPPVMAAVPADCAVQPIHNHIIVWQDSRPHSDPSPVTTQADQPGRIVITTPIIIIKV